MNKKIPLYIDNINNTEIKESKEHGFGLFAESDIKMNEILCEISGQILSKKNYLVFLKNNYKKNKHFFVEKVGLKDDKILAIPFRTKFSFINHSEENYNTDAKYNKDTNKLTVFTTKHIKKGDELLDKYNLDKHIDVLGGFGEVKF